MLPLPPNLPQQRHFPGARFSVRLESIDVQAGGQVVCVEADGMRSRRADPVYQDAYASPGGVEYFKADVLGSGNLVFYRRRGVERVRVVLAQRKRFRELPFGRFYRRYVFVLRD